MRKEVIDLNVGDTVHMFGGHRRPAHGAEVVVRRVGRAYLYVSAPKSGELAPEYKFQRDNGIEAVDSNYKRRLVIDRQSHLDSNKAKALFERLRRNIGFTKAEGVTAADIEAAAKLLQVDLEARR